MGYPVNLSDLIRAAVQRQPGPDHETLVIRNHLTQLVTFMTKQGLRFYPIVDGPLKQRQTFIDALLAQNRLDLYLWGIAEQFLAYGSVLWYLRPVGKEGYEILWYVGGTDDERQYRVIYKPGGRELDYAIIRYSWQEEPLPGQNAVTQETQRWTRLIITPQTIIEEVTRYKPSLSLARIDSPTTGIDSAIKRTELINSLGFIPCVESVNDPLFPGDKGHGEFDGILSQIGVEDELRGSMTENALMFNSATLVTTRPASQVVKEMGGVDSPANERTTSWAASQGFYGTSSPGPGGGVPFLRRPSWITKARRKISKVIGNVREDERFGYISPDPINGDIWRYAQEYREGLHQALGGIDPLSYRYTDWQSLRGLVGQVECTAKRKCASLFTHGLCRLLELAIYNEEALWFRSYRFMLAQEGMAEDKVIALTEDEILLDFYSREQVPPTLMGLAPYGDRSVRYEWLGPLFTPDPREQQVATINARNMQEAGVGSLYALQQVFPGKTEAEIKAMLTSVPLRYANDVTRTLSQLAQVQGQLMGLPDPADPAVPLAARVDMAPLMQLILDNFSKTLSSETAYDPTRTDVEPYRDYRPSSDPSTGSGSLLPVGPGVVPDFVSPGPVGGGPVSASPGGTGPGTGGLGTGFGGDALGRSPDGISVGTPNVTSDLIYPVAKPPAPGGNGAGGSGSGAASERPARKRSK